MKNDGIENNQGVTYYLAVREGAPIEKTLYIDKDEIQKTVLLQLYYCKMLNIKACTVEVVRIIMDWIYFKCYQTENMVAREYIRIPYYEGYRLLAQMYAKDLFDTVEDSEGSYFVLKELGIDLCKEYLI